MHAGLTRMHLQHTGCCISFMLSPCFLKCRAWLENCSTLLLPTMSLPDSAPISASMASRSVPSASEQEYVRICRLTMTHSNECCMGCKCGQVLQATIKWLLCHVRQSIMTSKLSGLHLTERCGDFIQTASQSVICKAQFGVKSDLPAAQGVLPAALAHPSGQPPRLSAPLQPEA